MALSVPFPDFSYHPHQEDAVRWMMLRESSRAEFVRGGILADEMGLGKTWMTIGLLLNNPVPETLLLVPPVLQPQWVEALQQSGIAVRVLVPVAKGKTDSPWKLYPGTRPEMQVTIATYTRATNCIAVVGAQAYGRIVCDEGHVFRNGDYTKAYRALVTIVAVRRWILSGTPIQNSVVDYRNLLLFLGMDKDTYKRQRPAAIAAVVMLRRTVGMVRDAVPTMPSIPPSHSVHAVEMPENGEEEHVFGQLVGRFNQAVSSCMDGLQILELYLRIRQFLAHPDIYVRAMKKKFGERYGREAWDHSASKYEAFKSWAETAEKKPTIVFTTFRAEGDQAEMAMRRAGYKVWNVRGGMTDSQRDKVRTESTAAHTAGEHVAIVIQIVVGSAGLNLQHCNRVVFLSSHWNPTIVDQAIARSYRIGQTVDVEVHHFLMADGAERNIDRIMAHRHGAKRLAALTVHDKLFCDSAADTGAIMSVLDSVCPPEYDIDAADEKAVVAVADSL